MSLADLDKLQQIELESELPQHFQDMLLFKIYLTDIGALNEYFN